MAKWKSRALYVLFVLLAVLLAFFHQDTAISFLLLYGLLLIGAAAAIASWCAPALLQISEHPSRECVFKDEEFLTTTEIRNRSPFPYPQVRFAYANTELLHFGDENTVAAVAPFNRSVAKKTCSLPYRGVYQLGIEGATVLDFAGLFQTRFSVRNPATVLVYPTGDADVGLSLQRDLQDLNRRFDFRRDPNSDNMDIRQYVPSDDYRKIHWKLTAKRSELMVKEYHPDIECRNLLFVDTREPPLEGVERMAFEDRMISGVTSAVEYCHENRLPAELVCGDPLEDWRRIEPGEDLTGTYRLLAELPFDQGDCGLSGLFQQLEPNAGSVNLLLFFTRLDGELAQVIHSCRALGHSVFLYYYPLPGEEEEPVAEKELLQQLENAGITVTVMGRDRDEDEEKAGEGHGPAEEL